MRKNTTQIVNSGQSYVKAPNQIKGPKQGVIGKHKGNDLRAGTKGKK